MYQKLTLSEITNNLRNQSSYMIIPFRKVLHEKYPSIFCDYECEINKDALPRALEELREYAISKGYDKAFVRYFVFPNFPDTELEVRNFKISEGDFSSSQILNDFIFLNDLFSVYEYDAEKKIYRFKTSLYSTLERYLPEEEKADAPTYGQVKSAVEQYMSFDLEEEAAKRRKKLDSEYSALLLTDREKIVLSSRFGIKNDHGPENRKEVGKIFNVTGERIKQIEFKAINKLVAGFRKESRIEREWLGPVALKKVLQNYNEDRSLLSNLDDKHDAQREEIPPYEIDDVIYVALNRLSLIERAILSYRYGLNGKDPLSIEELSSLFSFSLEEAKTAFKNALLHLQTPDVVDALKKAEEGFLKKYEKDDVVSYIKEEETATPINKLLLAKIIAPFEFITIEEDGRIIVHKGEENAKTSRRNEIDS